METDMRAAVSRSNENGLPFPRADDMFGWELGEAIEREADRILSRKEFEFELPGPVLGDLISAAVKRGVVQTGTANLVRLYIYRQAARNVLLSGKYEEAFEAWQVLNNAVREQSRK